MKFIREPIEDLPPLAIADIRRSLVAVLPFEAAADDPGLRLLGGEIADVLRERLEKDPALQAILISSDFLAKAPPHAVELICRELRVRYLVTGKCHAGSTAPSLYIEVTDTRDWHIHWAHFFRDKARSLLAAGEPEMDDLVATLRRCLVPAPAC